MKRFLRYILPLALVLVMTAPAWPAELTLSGQNIGQIGPLRVMTGFATTASADTLPFPFKNILYLGLTPRVTSSVQDLNAAEPPAPWYSISGTTITIYLDLASGSSGVRLDFFIVGY